MTRRIHITGASGSGTTSLGRALATALDLSHFDTDDFYWLPSEQAYSQKREESRRLALMEELFLPAPEWILSGSVMRWGDALIPRFDLVVFLHTPTETRLTRLRQREALRFGAEAIAPGGSRHQMHLEFLDWASHYDEPDFQGRSATRHEAWLEMVTCPVLRLDGSSPMQTLVESIEAALIPLQ